MTFIDEVITNVRRTEAVRIITGAAAVLLSNDSGTLPPINPTNTKIAEAVKVAARIYKLAEDVVDGIPAEEPKNPEWQTP